MHVRNGVQSPGPPEWRAPPDSMKIDEIGTAVGSAGPVTTSPTEAEDFLFVESGPAKGRGFRLAKNPTLLGRGTGVDIVIDDQRVSRTHLQLDRDAEGWSVQDLDSVNGTHVERARLAPRTPVRLAAGARIHVGDTVLRFVAKDRPSALLLESSGTTSTIDADTGLPSRVVALDELRRLVREAELRSEGLVVVAFWVRRFDQLRLMPGKVAAGCIRQLGEVLRGSGSRSRFVARTGPSHVLVVLPGVSPDEAAGFARGIVHRFLDPLTTGGLCLELTAGIATLGPDRSATDLVVLAETASLAAAQRASQVMDADRAPTGSTQLMERDGLTLVREVLARGGAHHLVALELASERELLQDPSLGVGAVAQAIRELREDAIDHASPDVEIGLWRDHYLLLAVPQASADDIDTMVDRITRAFAARPALAGARGMVPRLLRHAVVDAETVRARGENVLPVLVSHLAADSPNPGTDSQAALPHPLVALAVQRQARTTPLGRLKITLDSIETSLRFLVACELGWLFVHGSDESLAKAAKALRECGPTAWSMGHWQSLVFKLAQTLPADDPHPVVRATRAWLRRDASPSALEQRLREAVTLRNKTIGHGVGHDEHAYASDEREAGVTLGQLERALGPLRATELVSVLQIQRFPQFGDEDEGYEYNVRVLQGPLEVFPIERRKLDTQLQIDWCYLLHEGSAPIPLAPIALVQTCEHCRRIELFFADRVVPGPKGAQVSLKGIATNHAFATTLPWSRPQARLFELVDGR